MNILLEGSRSVSKPEGHHYILIITIPRTKGGLLFVSLLNPYTVVYIT